MDDRDGPDARARPTGIANSQGVQVGDGNIQVNLFTGERPTGPVVAGNVPQAPAAFQPREDLMAELRAAGAGVSVIRAVTGMRGVGKTQLAAAYARECSAAGWRLVAWVNAEDPQAVLTGLSVVADRLGIGQPGKSLGAVALAVRNRLEADGDRCLIVFDNATDPDVVQAYMPSFGDCQVLVTSTEAAVAAGGAAVPVGVFSEEEALAYLAGRTGLADEAGARALAAELGFLPLALALAAAVIAERRLTVGTYLDRLRGYPVEQYLPRAKGDPYPRGVAEAIGLSIDTVMAEDPTGTCDAVLGVVSLLSPDGVSTRLLEGGWGRRLLGGGCGRWLLEGGSGRIPVPWVRAHAAWRSARSLLRGKRNSTDPWAYDGVGRAGVEQALGRLTDASLLTFSGDGSTVLAHRLVARTVRERLKREGRLATVGAIARDLLLSNEVILHMQKISGNAPAYDRAADRDFARQAAALAAFLGPSARLGGKRKAQRALHSWAEAYEVLGESPDDAIARAAKQVSGCVRAHGEQHATTLDARISLAEAYLESAQRAEAIEQLETVYAVRRQVLGETAPGTVAAAGQLSGLYVSAGRLNEAAPLAALWLRRQHALGRTDASGNDIYLRTGYETAERAREEIPVHEMYVSVFAPVVGDADLHTIQFRINLAAAYRTVGRTDDAIGQYTRALAGLETAWGPENEVTIELRDLLAIVRQEAGERGSAPPD